MNGNEKLETPQAPREPNKSALALDLASAQSRENVATESKKKEEALHPKQSKSLPKKSKSESKQVEKSASHAKSHVCLCKSSIYIHISKQICTHV